MKLPISFLIPTFNEEKNIEYAIKSCVSISDDINIIDSFSTDKTLDIAKKYGVNIVQHKFEGYSKQWNWALDNIPFKYDYVFLLAADESLSSELIDTLINISNKLNNNTAYYVSVKLIWLEKWIKRGYYPLWVVRLFDRHKCRFDDRTVNEHLVIPDNKTKHIEGDILHDDHNGLNKWVTKHLKYSDMESELLFKEKDNAKNFTIWKDLIKGTQERRKKWLRYNIYNNFPPMIRPFLYFSYRYFFRLGFLDGKEGFIFHFLQGLWFPFLIDVKYMEMKRKKK